MNMKDIAYLGCRFYALYILSGILNILSFAHNSSNTLDIYGFTILFDTVIFIALWLNSDWLASRVLGGYADKKVTINPNVESFQTVGFIFIGIGMATHSVQSIAGLVGLKIFTKQGGGVESSTIVLIKESISFAIGIFLIFGANCISKTIIKLRKL